MRVAFFIADAKARRASMLTKKLGTGFIFWLPISLSWSSALLTNSGAR